MAVMTLRTDAGASACWDLSSNILAPVCALMTVIDQEAYLSCGSLVREVNADCNCCAVICAWAAPIIPSRQTHARIRWIIRQFSQFLQYVYIEQSLNKPGKGGRNIQLTAGWWLVMYIFDHGKLQYVDSGICGGGGYRF